MKSLLLEGSKILKAAGVTTESLDAELLMTHVLGVDRAYLHAHRASAVRDGDAARFKKLIARRAAREPLQYITGVQEFWSLPFQVSPAVLIPRPESELLIEVLLCLNRRDDPCVLDIGTGSGCLAVAAAHEIPGALVHATDISEGALAIARHNAAANDVGGRVAFYKGDLFDPLQGLGMRGRVDFILSNPPYVGAVEIDGLQPEVKDHEPRGALVPGSDSLAVHGRLARESRPFLRPGGFLIVELGQGQAGPARDLYARSPGLEVAEVRLDLAGIERVLIAHATTVG